jgi:hypothetical protein
MFKVIFCLIGLACIAILVVCFLGILLEQNGSQKQSSQRISKLKINSQVGLEMESEE